jgi:hypothetical protein
VFHWGGWRGWKGFMVCLGVFKGLGFEFVVGGSGNEGWTGLGGR